MKKSSNNSKDNNSNKPTNSATTEINRTKNSDASEEERLNSKTMRLSIFEGAFGVFSTTLSDNYITPFALSIDSTSFQIGMLTSFGGLLSPIGQIISSRLIEKRSRKKVIVSGILGQASLWPLFLLLAILFYYDLFKIALSWILIAFYVIYMIFAGIVTPPWFSLMGDIVPKKRRGRYFAKRNLITTAIAIGGTLVFSFVLDWFKEQQEVILGFMIIFIFGLVVRLFSAFLFTKHHYPTFNYQPTNRTKFKKFLKEMPHTNFGVFTLFVALIVFAQWIAQPFFAVYMLEELNFNYSIFILINLFSSITALFVFPLLGIFSDKFGNVRLLRLGALIIPFVPMLWLFFYSPLELMLFPQLLGGIGWTAFNLATSNFIYDNIPSEKRIDYVAFYNFIIGIGIVVGGFIGGLIISFFPIDFMNKFQFVFVLSGIVRLLIVIVFLPKIKEVRKRFAKPIFNLKNLSIYRWLYDILMREQNHKKNNNNNA